MHRSILVKFFAILLCAAVLLAALCAGGGIIALAAAELYTRDVKTLQQQEEEYALYSVAHSIAQRYTVEESGVLPPELVESFIMDHSYRNVQVNQDLLFYTLKDGDGNLLASKAGNFLSSQVQTYEFWVSTARPTQITDISVPVDHSGFYEHYSFTDEAGFHHEYRVTYTDASAYLVTLHLLPGAYTPEYPWLWQLAEFGYTYRYHLIWMLGAALLVFALLLVFLCCVAGRKPKSQEIHPGGLNRLPLDLYGGVAGFGIVLLVVGGYELLRWSIPYFEPQWLLVLLLAVMAYAACLLLVGFCFAFAAQCKAGNGFWYRHTVLGWLIRLAVRLLKTLFGWLKAFFAWLKKAFVWLISHLPGPAKKVWGFFSSLCIAAYRGTKKLLVSLFSLLGKYLALLWRGFQRMVSLLPLTWQWLLTAFFLLLLMSAIVSPNFPTGLVILGIGICMAIVMYGTYCFGTLLESTKRMGQGDLDTQIEDKLLLGSFRDYATHLNDLAGVAVEAAKKQMKSERMKAELITNVSHDIKTPLTSIINYVDLLQKAETPEQTAEYLAVLDRQSQRLKKLIDDLMEMSKASTGNMAVNLAQVDATEAITQALGEFSDKLTQAQLIPVFNPPEDPIFMEADGRLTWRVLSNLLSNAVKYALPGTRLYIDLVKLEGKVLISLKNISREPLNVSSEELMERFVRGDASRNTEGSGLGLNIAQSLMELQNGQLQLLVDGDLFKATLFFPESN